VNKINDDPKLLSEKDRKQLTYADKA